MVFDPHSFWGLDTTPVSYEVWRNILGVKIDHVRCFAFGLVMHAEARQALHQAVVAALAIQPRPARPTPRQTFRWERQGNGWGGQAVLMPGLPALQLPTQITEYFAAQMQTHHPAALKMIGSALTGGSYAPPETWVRAALTEYWRRAGGWDGGAALVDAIVDEIADFVADRYLRLRFVVPVSNFQMDEPTEIRLGDLVCLSPLDEAAFNELYPDLFEVSTVMRSQPHFALIGEIDEPKQEGEIHGVSLNAARLENAIDQAILALRTFKAGQVGCDWLQFFLRGFSLHGSRFSGRELSRWAVSFGSYWLTRDEIDDLRCHYELLQKSDDPSIELACARLAMAESRRDPVDQLLDAAIGLEALLLAGGDSRTEVRFRFSMNYAMLGTSSADKNARFLLAQSLYDLRSTVAHGSKSRNWKFDGEIQDPHVVGERARAMLRNTLKQFLRERLLPNARQPAFWRARYFAGAGGVPTVD